MWWRRRPNSTASPNPGQTPELQIPQSPLVQKRSPSISINFSPVMKCHGCFLVNKFPFLFSRKHPPQKSRLPHLPWVTVSLPSSLSWTLVLINVCTVWLSLPHQPVTDLQPFSSAQDISAQASSNLTQLSLTHQGLQPQGSLPQCLVTMSSLS